MTGFGVGPNTAGVLAVVGALGTDAGPLLHSAASSAKEAPTASRVMTFLVIDDMRPLCLSGAAKAYHMTTAMTRTGKSTGRDHASRSNGTAIAS
jgi:hypothetical protein